MKRHNSPFPFLTKVIFTIAFIVCHPVYADVYRCDSTPGLVTLTNQPKGKSCKKMVLPPPDKPLNKSAASGNAKAPLPDATAKSSKYKAGYDNAVSERKRIIQEEVDLEHERLDAVNAKMTKLDGLKTKTASQTKELALLQKKQALHQGNLDLLQKELNKH
jgi:hypothetical protein